MREVLRQQQFSPTQNGYSSNMIPEGITINPMQGEYNSEVQVTVDPHSGRLMKSPREVYCWTSDDTAKDMLEIKQDGKQEYISISSALDFTVDVMGGTVIVSGKSNSALLGVARLDDTPQISYQLYINGTLIPEWDYLKPRFIPGDPGALEEYDWEIHVTVEENRTTEPRTWQFYINNDASIQTAVITVRQAEGAKTYDVPVVDTFIYKGIPVEASGGIAEVDEITYHQDWGWNGDLKNGGTLYDGGTITYSGTYINTVTGQADIPTKGTVISNTTVATVVSAVVTMNGKSSLPKTADVTQKPNYMTGMTPSKGSLSYPDIPSSGGTAEPVVISPSFEYSYTSGSIGTELPASEYGTLETILTYTLLSVENNFVSVDSKTGVLTATDRGIDAGDDWLSGIVNLHFDYKWNHSEEYIAGGIIEADYDLQTRGKQLRNVPVSIEITSHEFSYPAITPSANSATPSCFSNARITFSSEQVLENVVPGDYDGYLIRIVSTYTLAAVQNGFIAVDSNTGVLSATNMGNILGSRESAEVTEHLVYELIIDSQIGGGILTDESDRKATCIQGVNEVTYSDLQVELQVPNIPAYGGSVNAGAVNYQQTATYTSGTVETVAIGGNIVFGDPVIGDDLGTVLTPRTAKGSLSATVTANGETVTVTETVYQEANVVEQLTVDPDFSYDSSLIPAIGGSKSPILNGSVILLFSSNHTVTHESSSTELQYSITSQRHFTMVESAGFSINTDTGVVTAEHNAHRAPQRTSGNITSILTWQYVPQTGLGDPINESASKTVSGVTQEDNYVIQIQLSIEKYQPDNTWDSVDSWNALPADDGYIGVWGKRTYTFRDRHTEIVDAGKLSVSQGLTVNVDWAEAHTNGGLHIKNRTTVIGNARTGQVAWQESGAISSNSLSFTQIGNYVESIDVACSISYSKSVSAAGGTVTPTLGSSRTFTFTSGSTSTSTPSSTYGTLTGSNSFIGSAANGFSAPNASTGVMTASDRGSTIGEARSSGTVTYTRSETWTPSSSYNTKGAKSDSATDTDYATQVANQIESTTRNSLIASASCGDIPASGGSKSLSDITVTATAIYVRTYTSGTVTENREDVVTSLIETSWNREEAVSASSLGTTVKSRTAIATVTITAEYLSSLTDDVELTIYQAANAITNTTYSDVKVSSLNLGTIPASGGSISTGICSYSQTRTYTYTSGSTSSSTLTSGGEVSWTTVSASSKGTVVSEATIAGTITCTVTMNGKSGSTTGTVFQQPNYLEYYSVSPDPASLSRTISHNGGTLNASGEFSFTVYSHYTSGSQKRETGCNCQLGGSLQGMTYAGNTVSHSWLSTSGTQGTVISVSQNRSQSNRSGNVTYRFNVTGYEGVTAEIVCSITQYGAPADMNIQLQDINALGIYSYEVTVRISGPETTSMFINSSGGSISSNIVSVTPGRYTLSVTACSVKTSASINWQQGHAYVTPTVVEGEGGQTVYFSLTVSTGN